jgi:hypothetical protein
VFSLPGLLASQVPDELIRSLAIGGSGAGETKSENGSGESSARTERGSVTSDYRHAAGATIGDESGADDDLVAALLSAGSDFDRATDNDLFPGFDLGTGLLTRSSPKADIQPHRGSRLGSVATLVSGEAGDEAVTAPDGGGDEELPLRDLLIDPIRKSAASRAEVKPAQGTVPSEPSAACEPVRQRAKLGAATAFVWGILLLGATLGDRRPAIGNRMPACRRRLSPTGSRTIADWPPAEGRQPTAEVSRRLRPSIYSPLTRNFTVTGK